MRFADIECNMGAGTGTKTSYTQKARDALHNLYKKLRVDYL